MSGSGLPKARDDNRSSFGGDFVLRDAGDPSTTGPPDADAYVTLITDRVDVAEKRATALEARAVTVITTSGTLVTLLLALAALVTRTQTFQVPKSAITIAAFAAFAFVAAAICALLANLPAKRWDVLPDTVRDQLWERWGDGGDRPLEKVSATRLEIWSSVEKQNNAKANAVFAAVTAQGVAIALLTIAVAIILL
jgi:hypothetical protein